MGVDSSIELDLLPREQRLLIKVFILGFHCDSYTSKLQRLALWIRCSGGADDLEDRRLGNYSTACLHVQGNIHLFDDYVT